jgi:hypothetical protein
MSETLMPNEVRQKYINLMGNDLGEAYYELWQDVIRLHIEWKEYVELYGTKPSRIDMLNETASQFFYIVEKSLWNTILIHITRLTDPPQSGNRKNLSLKHLLVLLSDDKLKSELTTYIKEVIEKSKFCRDWRNRLIAHNDYELVLYDNAKPLEFASRKLVNEAIKSIDDTMDCISMYYEKSTTAFNLIDDINGARSLLYYLNCGLKFEKKRRERLLSGKFDKEDLQNDSF